MADEEAQTSSVSDSGDTESAEVYLEAARHRLDAQVTITIGLDNRVAATFGVGSTVLPLTIGLLNQQFSTVDTWIKALLAAAIAAYVVLLYFSLGAYSLRTISFRPDVSMLQMHSLAYREDVLRRWVADEYVRSIVVNNRILTQKR